MLRKRGNHWQKILYWRSFSCLCVHNLELGHWFWRIKMRLVLPGLAHEPPSISPAEFLRWSSSNLKNNFNTAKIVESDQWCPSELGLSTLLSLHFIFHWRLSQQTIRWYAVCPRGNFRDKQTISYQTVRCRTSWIIQVSQSLPLAKINLASQTIQYYYGWQSL